MNDRPLRFHLSLNVEQTHFDAMVAFYSTLFGGEPVKRKPGYAKFEPVEPYVNLAFNSVEEAPSGELDHLGIQVFSDDTLAAARARITGLGVAVRDEQEIDCCYASQNKFWVTDPTGRQIEFFHVLRDVEHSRKMPTLDAVNTACCAPPAAASTACCAPKQSKTQEPGSGCC